MASRLRSFSRPAAAFLRSSATRSAAAALPRSLAPVARTTAVGRWMGLARSLQPLHSAVSAARLTSRLGAEVARAVSQDCEDSKESDYIEEENSQNSEQGEDISDDEEDQSQ